MPPWPHIRTRSFFLDVLSTNAVGVFRCMRTELAAMLAQGGGGIVNVASVAGLRGQEHLGRG